MIIVLPWDQEGCLWHQSHCRCRSCPLVSSCTRLRWSRWDYKSIIFIFIFIFVGVFMSGMLRAHPFQTHWYLWYSNPPQELPGNKIITHKPGLIRTKMITRVIIIITTVIVANVAATVNIITITITSTSINKMHGNLYQSGTINKTIIKVTGI